MAARFANPREALWAEVRRSTVNFSHISRKPDDRVPFDDLYPKNSQDLSRDDSFGKCSDGCPRIAVDPGSIGTKSSNAMTTCSAISDSVVYVESELTTYPLPFTGNTEKDRLFVMKATSINENFSARV